MGSDSEDSAHAFVEGVMLGSYRFDRYKERPIDEASSTELLVKRHRKLERVLLE